MLRRVFYASASVLMLALAYHLGASRVAAQGGGLVAGSFSHDSDVVGIDMSGQLWFISHNPGGRAGPFPLPMRISAIMNTQIAPS